MLPATWKKNDRKATILIVLVSVIVFAIISILGRVTLNVNLGFDPHIFAKANAVINSVVAVLLLCGLIAVKAKHYLLHKRIMLTAMVLSILFLISYICHHLFAGEARFGDINHDGVLSEAEKDKCRLSENDLLFHFRNSHSISRTCFAIYSFYSIQGPDR